MQNKINQYDEQGEAHGYWKKFWTNNGDLWYEGKFIHGRALGYYKIDWMGSGFLDKYYYAR